MYLERARAEVDFSMSWYLNWPWAFVRGDGRGSPSSMCGGRFFLSRLWRFSMVNSARRSWVERVPRRATWAKGGNWNWFLNWSSCSA